jgi:hypothetical protein
MWRYTCGLFFFLKVNFAAARSYAPYCEVNRMIVAVRVGTVKKKWPIMENLLLRKLLVQPGHRLLYINAPGDPMDILGPLPDGVTCAYEADGVYNVILLFARNTTELYNSLAAIEANKTDTTLLWVLFPRKASGISTDLEAMISWQGLTQYGLRIVASAGINDTWTAVRLRKIALTRPSGTSLDAIAQNNYGNYINVAARTVTMPDDMKAAVAMSEEAMLFFDQLSFSNRKEYVLWVLTAKQEKTRSNRIAQSVTKLAAGKKNPSVK